MCIRHFSRILIGIFLVGFLSACDIEQTLTITPTIPAITTNFPQATIHRTPTPTATATKEPPPLIPTPSQQLTVSPEPYLLPLTAYGPNFIGKRIYNFVDENRDNRQVGITVWYPAIKPEGFVGTSLVDAEPDQTGAPYPVVLTSTKTAGYFAYHLVSHGFTVVSVNKLDSYIQFDNTMIDMPLDFLFALNKAGSSSFEGLDGMLNAEYAGMMGYSFGGYNSLAMSGARVHPEHYMNNCADPEVATKVIYPDFIEYQCALMDKWDDFESHAGEALSTSDDGLWQPMTDARIRTVIPMAPEGWLLFGKRGLASVDRPVLIIVGSRDLLSSEDLVIFENLGTPDRFLISIVDQNHMMIFRSEILDRMKHFVVAFFGYYLQGRQEYASYFSENFISQYQDLIWGK